jgi:hypothetical protein
VLSDLAKGLLGLSETICDGRVGPSYGCVRAHPEDNLASQGFVFREWRVGEKSRKESMGSFCRSNEMVVRRKRTRAAPPVRTKTTF